MPRNLIETSTFTATITVPENGDPVTAENRDPSLQALANRTAYLKAERDRMAPYIGGDTGAGEWAYPSARARTLRFSAGAFETAKPPSPTDPGAWELYDPVLDAVVTDKASSAVQSVKALNLNRLLALGTTITGFRVLVAPGAARVSNRMSAELLRTSGRAFTGTEAAGSVTGVGSNSDDGTSDVQSISVSGLSIVVDSRGLTLRVMSGTGDTTEDVFYGAEVDINDPGPINT